MTKRFGILTAGGDCPGLNATIRAIVKTAQEKYSMEVLGFRHGFRGLLEGDHTIIGPEMVSGILTQGGTILGTSREPVFRNEEGDTRDKPALIRQVYDRLGLECLVVLGGNGTHRKAYLLQQETGIRVIGLPKTIDNDIYGTDQCFGFASAVQIAAEAIDRIHTTAHSHNRVMVVEVMGHHAGWLALYAGVAGGGDVILIPEIPYDLPCIAGSINRRAAAGKEFSIAVVAEGALSRKEAKMSKKERKKSLRNKPSVGFRVASQIEKETGLESRMTVLGYVQRGGSPCPEDRLLATRMGSCAADMIASGQFGRMVSLRDGRVTSVDLGVVADRIRYVGAQDPLLVAARNIGTCFGDDGDDT